VNGKGLRRRLSEQKLFEILLSVSGLVGRGLEKKTCSWLVIVFVMGTSMFREFPKRRKKP
jgi:hypothetical protein